VSDEDIPTSGSRWEPADGAAPEFTRPVAGTPVPPPAGQARPRRLPRRLLGRSAVATAGVGLVLAGGLGGFAIGHAAAGGDVTDNRTVTDADQNGVPDDGPGGRPDVDRDGDHRSPDGTAPDGTPPDGAAPGETSPDTDDDGGTA
jgi:hypothetical protein